MTDEIGTITKYPALIRREWVFGTLPDSRDARIARLENALVEVRNNLAGHSPLSFQDVLNMRLIDTALMYPESDMTITVEDLPA